MRRATGIVRRIDSLGRFLLPSELRQTMGLPPGTPLGIFVDDQEGIILRRHEPGCLFCGLAEGLEDFHGRPICGRCRAEIRGELL